MVCWKDSITDWFKSTLFMRKCLQQKAELFILWIGILNEMTLMCTILSNTR